MSSNDPPTDSITPPHPMHAHQPSAFPTPPPMHSGGLSQDAIVVHLSYITAQIAALVPKVDAVHDASVRRDGEIRALRADVREMGKTLDEHGGLHRQHKDHLGRHCGEIDDLNSVAANNGEPKSWVGKLGAKAVDALIPMLMTIMFMGALAGWTGIRLKWGEQSHPAEPAKDAGKPAAQGATQ